MVFDEENSHNVSWPSKNPEAYDLSRFKINWKNRIVTCPQGVNLLVKDAIALYKVVKAVKKIIFKTTELRIVSELYRE